MTPNSCAAYLNVTLLYFIKHNQKYMLGRFVFCPLKTYRENDDKELDFWSYIASGKALIVFRKYVVPTLIFILGLFLVGSLVAGKGELTADGMGYGRGMLLFGGLPCVAFSFLLYGIRSLQFRLGFPLLLSVCVIMFILIASQGKVSKDGPDLMFSILLFGGTFSLHHYLLPRRK